jgi:hypothetical protein
MHSEHNEDPRPSSPSWFHKPIGRSLIPSLAAIIGGIILAATRLNRFLDGDEGATILFWCGLAVAAVGVVTSFVTRWMSKRGI